ncbi:MAG: transglycosylase SLT domain-containing protein [Gemmobacter sp.]|uniref:transglycosylase SLT domain-containing protein n=1 Tax=Gemmobacter sp. TaxID=1898957 RepID=UPI001A4B9D86|nr:transglycosylase SLT domain-containing protein [Gemmobacter sp.]MBL8563903.1 transglycosylase SLT domain-containing protein [Gemmobacter sp.]
MSRKIGLFGLIAALTLAGCSLQSTQKAEATTVPPMRWDHHPEAAKWTTNTLLAVAEEDAVLAARVPADIAQWCPGYESASLPERRAFWAGLISAVGKYESSYNPRAAGGGGRYIGIMQISPRSAANYGCDARSSGALKDGSANLACAVEMVAHNVARDGVAVGGGNRGIGRDWMPFRKADKRAEMRAWLSSQSYCQ